MASFISRSRAHLVLLAIAGATIVQSGCTTIRGVPAARLPDMVKARTKANLIEISLTRLRQTPPDVYQLAEKDVLGIYIQNVLGNAEEAPPVNFPEDASQAPAIGFPIPIREDGTLALPLVDPIQVAGLTVTQATEAIRKAYTEDREILVKGEDRIIVTLMRRRHHRVLVVREESGNQGASNGITSVLGQTKKGAGFAIDLPAYENDLLHALNETGGLPGLDAERYVLIYKGGFSGSAERDAMVASLNGGIGQCGCRIPLPDDPNVIKVPIRFYPEEVPQFEERDIILEDGDVVYVPSRDRERYYTGGVLAGGEHLIPRDYDLDVLQAVSIAGGSFGAGTGLGALGGGGGGGGAGNIYGNATGGAIAPSRAIVLRKLPNCGTEVPIEVNLKKALTDPSERILVAPEDTIIVRYTVWEELANVALGLFQFNYFLND